MRRHQIARGWRESGRLKEDKSLRRTIRGQLAGELGRQSEQSVVSQHGEPQAAQRGQLRLHQRDEAVGRKHVGAQVLVVLILVRASDRFGRHGLSLSLDLHRHHIYLTESTRWSDALRALFALNGQ